MIDFCWKLCSRIYNFLFCCVMDFGLRFQVVLHLREICKWRKLYCFHVRNTCTLPFKSEVGCFKGVVVWYGMV